MSFQPTIVLSTFFGIATMTGLAGAQLMPCQIDGLILSENADPNTILPGGSVACQGGGTFAHAYGRSHDVAELNLSGDVALTCVHWGIEKSDEAHTAVVRVYLDIDGDRVPGSSTGDLVELGSATQEIPATSDPMMVTFNFVPEIEWDSLTTSLIFIELETPSSSGDLIIGANNAGESTPSYLRTINGDCNIPDWTTTGSIGFPSVAYVEAAEFMLAGTGDPCDELLPECVADIAGPGEELDQQVDVNDVLAVIANFGVTGDGTFRPTGDCDPMPTGDCQVTVDDLLTVIAAFGTECAPIETGACCLTNGQCEIVTSDDCDNAGGSYQGDNTDCSQCATSGVMINETRLNEPGTDDNEYVEFVGTPGESLDGLAFIVIGDGSATGVGAIEEAVALDGLSINAAGFFVIGEPTMTIAVPDYAYELNFESNDQTTFLLVSGFTGMFGDDLDTDDDGVLDIEPWDSIIDCVAFVGPDPASGDPVYCDVQVGPDGIYTPGHAYLCDVDWLVGTFELSILDTPGDENNCDTSDSDGDGVYDIVDNCPDLANPDQQDCDSDGVGDACAIADGLSADCNSNGIPDECEADCNGNGSPDDCDVDNGNSEDCDGNGNPDECDPDCNGNNVPDVCDIADGTSEDSDGNGVPDECEGLVFVINEINADPDSTLGDANGDGVANYADDEFFELVNMSGADIDMSGWVMSDATADRHTFPFGTIVGDGCAVVVFGGGEPAGDFGGAIVMTASSGYMGLNNGGDTITIRDANGTIQLEEAYGSAGNNQSITRNPDVFGTDWADHSTVAPDGALFSPGTRIDGVSFGGDCGGGQLPDSDGDGVPDDYDNCDLPNEDQADCNENGIGDVCDLADGTSIDENGNGIPDECEQTVGGGWINEFHYDNGGSDLNEFIEIVILDGVDIANVELSLYNGSNGTVYASYAGGDLTAGEAGAGYTIYSVLHEGIQNGAPDGFCLTIGGSVAHFISYEGSLTATAGPAVGLSSEDVGVSESSGTNEFSSLGLSGSGADPAAFTWTTLTDLANPGQSNDGQTIAP
ncbi:MAG: lamin tail domain-containing protein [Phycisphaerales bacterium]|nr:lamin tail domain-containing protein [Phycisphaerales bacterium]